MIQKLLFYISLISVIINIIISVYYFQELGFIIIPIATSIISSWLNSILLLIFLKREIYLVLMKFLL